MPISIAHFSTDYALGPCARDGDGSHGPEEEGMFRFATSMGLVVVSLVGVVGTASAADYTGKGSLTTKTTALPNGQGGSSGGKLVVPDAAGSYPLIVASHGFSANASNQVGWAEHFASYGF